MKPSKSFPGLITDVDSVQGPNGNPNGETNGEVNGEANGEVDEEMPPLVEETEV